MSWASNRSTEVAVARFQQSGARLLKHPDEHRLNRRRLEIAYPAVNLQSLAGDPAMDLVGYKKELMLDVMNEKGQVALRYFLHACWVSEYQALPDLDANANAVAIENIKFEVEGWERDTDTIEPDESA